MRLHDAWHIRLEAEREAKIKSLEEEIARLRLTDEEREAVEWCIFQQATPQRIAVTLRGLLDRLGHTGSE